MTHFVEAARPDDRFRQVVEALPQGYVSFDAEWRFTECNAAAERLFGRKRQELIGQELCAVSGLTAESAFAALARRVAASRMPEDAELTYRRSRRARLLAIRAFPVGDGVAAVWRDITNARAAERRLALSEARYREIADGVPAAAWMSRANGKLEFINQAMADAVGRPREALLGDGWISSIDPKDRAALLRQRAAARTEHNSFHYEGRFRRPDGALRIIEMYGRPRFDDRGAFAGHVGVAADITDAREHEQRQTLLIDELNHRVKNTLATVQSVIRHTLRDYNAPPEVEQALTERVVALAAAHNVLSRDHWRDASLAGLASEVLQPYAHAGRVAIRGPDVRISPKTAIALSMGLLELATNAAKYGGLSTPDGRVELSWLRRDDKAVLEWRETGGPPSHSPKPSGFGARLLGRVLAGELGRPAQMDYASGNLVCRFQAPVET